MTSTPEAMAREAFPGGPDDTEAGRAWWDAHAEALTRFAALVRAQALKDAAGVSDWLPVEIDASTGIQGNVRSAVEQYAAAIRALPPSAG